ncbi:unnamed protein product, partial [Didymodactylos carnosus]
MSFQSKGDHDTDDDVPIINITDDNVITTSNGNMPVENGGRSHSLVDDITHYRFSSSIFDLVSVSTFKFVLFIILYTELETRVIFQLYYQSYSSLLRYLLILLTLTSHLISLAYSIVKLLFVLKNTSSLQPIYLSIVYIFLVFSSLELIGFIILQPYLNRLKLIEEKRDLSVKKKADLKRLLSLSKNERSLIAIGTFFLILSAATQIVQPYYFGKIVDNALKSRTMKEVNTNLLILFIINCVGALTSFIRSWTFELAGQRMVYRLRKSIFSNLTKQEIAFFDETRTGELTNRLSSDTQVLQNAVTVNISMLLRFSLQLIGSLAVMFYLEVSLTLVLMAVVPVVILISMQYGKLVRKLRKTFQDELANAGTTAEECISNMRTVRMFGSERKMNINYSDNVYKSYLVGKKLAFNSGLFMGVTGLLTAAGISAVLWYGAKLVHDGKLSAGLLTSFLMYMLQVALAFAFLSSLYGDFMQAVGASERIFDLLDKKGKIPTEDEHGQMAKPHEFDGSIRVQDVCFKYPTRQDQQVLTNISFEIKHGQKVALVGPSGGGKSTIASLIERFYDPTSGVIYLGPTSIPLTDVDPLWLREHVSFVNQEPCLFACSIKDNICFGKQGEVAMEEIIRVAKQANAHDFIDSFDQKYDTLVGERGVRLSGGQKQRICIARSLLINPQLLLLDEATSALDAESEHLVQEAIERAMIDRTVLVIAHRLSTV